MEGEGEVSGRKEGGAMDSITYTCTYDKEVQHPSSKAEDVHILEARLGQAAVQGGLPAFEALRDVDARSLLLPIHSPPGRLALA